MRKIANAIAFRFAYKVVLSYPIATEYCSAVGGDVTGTALDEVIDKEHWSATHRPNLQSSLIINFKPANMNNQWQGYYTYPRKLVDLDPCEYDTRFYNDRLRDDSSRLFTDPNDIKIQVLDIPSDDVGIEGRTAFNTS